MGLESRVTGKTFVNMFNGKFVIRVDEKTPGAISRTNKNNKTVHELHYTSLTGILTGIAKRESNDPTIGITWEIEITDDKAYVLNLPYAGGLSFKLFTKLINVPDFSNPVTIGIGLKDEKTQLFVSQNVGIEQKHMKAFWTKDTPHGLPPLRKIKLKGKDTWDDSEQMAFIEKIILTKLAPKLKSIPFPNEAQDHKNFQPTASNSFKGTPPPAHESADLPDWAQDKPDNGATDDLPF